LWRGSAKFARAVAQASERDLRFPQRVVVGVWLHQFGEEETVHIGVLGGSFVATAAIAGILGVLSQSTDIKISGRYMLIAPIGYSVTRVTGASSVRRARERLHRFDNRVHAQP
jgi:hypothetical protein